jgi:trehalose 6-phosphate synthase
LRVILRFAGVAIFVATIVILAVLPFATSFIEQWSRRDVELRSRLVFNSIRDQVALHLSEGSGDRLPALFERITTDERLLAIGYCDTASALRFPSAQMPPDFTCEKAARSDKESFSVLAGDSRQILVGAFPIAVRGSAGHLIVLHDLSYVERRGTEARNFLFLALAGVAFGGAALASMIAFILLRRWMGSIRQAIEDVRAGRGEAANPNLAPVGLGAEVRRALQELDSARRSADSGQAEWNPETLRIALANELAGSEVIVVSNREPYIHNRTEDGGVSLQIPASGLVAALEPVMRACGGTWVAHGSGSADRDTVDPHDRLQVPPSAPAYALRRLWLSEEEQDGYYYGFANEGLWPLCHIAFVRPVFREFDWRMYRAVNERFAEAVVTEASRPDPIILVQDYHFGLLPRMIRERLPQATIITFWHIPWPNSETFGICPYKEEIVDGLLGSSILGFHTQFHCNNFIETVDRFIESRIDRERDSITLKGEETLVRPYPISIEWPPAALAGQKPVPECRAAVRERLGLPPDIRLGVGIERFDYTKGILDRMYAVHVFLEANPEWEGRFCFVQAAAPTRSKLNSYRHLQEEAEALAQEINKQHAKPGGIEPIRLVVRHHEPDEVFELFRAADLCIVSSLHDGMNLVAKEFVAARDDEMGVLVLSAFAGASRELSEALIVNPYDAQAMGGAIQRALTMDEAEQRERIRLMREQVRARNVYRWAGQMLLDAARLRKRQRIRRIIAKGQGTSTADV